jgi:hypothetical protein
MTSSTVGTRVADPGFGVEPRPARDLATSGTIGRIDLTFTHADPYDPQIDHYAIHAAQTPGVPIGPETLLAKTVYTRFRHERLGGRSQTWHYRVVVVTAAGRRSEPSPEVSGRSTESVVYAGRPLATVGTFDGRSLEFALAPNHSSQYPARFPNDVDFTVGADDPATDWSYIHPGPSDSWAGRKAHRMTLRFGLDRVPDQQVWLAIWLIDTHATLAGRGLLGLNGREVREITFEGGATRGSLEGDANLPGSPLRPSYVELPLPRETLTTGENVLTLDKVEGSWHVYDAVGIFSKP